MGALLRRKREVDLAPPRGPKKLPSCLLNVLLFVGCGPYRGTCVRTAVSSALPELACRVSHVSLGAQDLRPRPGLGCH